MRVCRAARRGAVGSVPLDEGVDHPEQQPGDDGQVEVGPQVALIGRPGDEPGDDLVEAAPLLPVEQTIDAVGHAAVLAGPVMITAGHRADVVTVYVSAYLPLPWRASRRRRSLIRRANGGAGADELHAAAEPRRQPGLRACGRGPVRS